MKPSRTISLVVWLFCSLLIGHGLSFAAEQGPPKRDPIEIIQQIEKMAGALFSDPVQRRYIEITVEEGFASTREVVEQFMLRGFGTELKRIHDKSYFVAKIFGLVPDSFLHDVDHEGQLINRSTNKAVDFDLLSVYQYIDPRGQSSYFGILYRRASETEE